MSQVVASKYLNDEGEMEALTNTEWASIGEWLVGVASVNEWLVGVVKSLSSLGIIFLQELCPRPAWIYWNEIFSRPW